MEAKQDKIISKINEILRGESPLSFYFSYKGTFNRLQFFGAIITFCLLFNFVGIQDIFWLTFLFSVPVFYGMIAAVQKRSRDIGKKGTGFILIYSLFLYCGNIIYFVKLQNISLNIICYEVMFIVTVAYWLSFILLLFIRGKKEKNLSLTSPLLKSPIKYLSIWIGIFLLSYLGLCLMK